MTPATNCGETTADGQCHCTSSLTHREIEVLQYLVTGMRTCDITWLLGISGKTIIAHKRNAMRKLHIRNNQELHRWMELGGSSHLNNHPFAPINNPPRERVKYSMY